MTSETHGENDDAARCPVCGSQRCARLFKVPFPRHSASGRRAFLLGERVDVPTWTIARCADCSVAFAFPRPTREEIDGFYRDQAEPNDWEVNHYVRMRAEGQRGWERFAEKLTRLNGGPGAMLEVGCAAGWLLKAAREQGWRVSGLEAAPKFQKYARDVLHLPVALGTIGDLDVAQTGQFDLIVMTDVIEHLQDPVNDLRRLRPLLRQGGWLVLATCDIGSPLARLYGLEWRQIVISHTVYFTRKSMCYALQHAGFGVQKFSEPRYWDPDLRVEIRGIIRETAKLAARAVLQRTYAPWAAKYPDTADGIVRRLSRARFDCESLMYRIGDQAVLGDVMLVLAKPM